LFWKGSWQHFIDFLHQHGMAEVAKTRKKHMLFYTFAILAVGLLG